MPKYENIGVDQAAFHAFIDSPTKQQLGTFVELLGSDEQANSWFEVDVPAWHENPTEWARARLKSDDWYAQLSEPEMVAWENAIVSIVDRCNFETKADLATMEHASVDFDVFEFAAAVYESKGQDCICGKMHPYRFHGLPPEIEEVEPWARVFHLNHAMLDVSQVEQLFNELTGYEELLSNFTPGYESVFNSIEERKLNAINESRDLLGFLVSLIETDSMWLAMIDQ